MQLLVHELCLVLNCNDSIDGSRDLRIVLYLLQIVVLETGKEDKMWSFYNHLSIKRQASGLECILVLHYHKINSYLYNKWYCMRFITCCQLLWTDEIMLIFRTVSVSTVALLQRNWPSVPFGRLTRLNIVRICAVHSRCYHFIWVFGYR